MTIWFFFLVLHFTQAFQTPHNSNGGSFAAARFRRGVYWPVLFWRIFLHTRDCETVLNKHSTTLPWGVLTELFCFVWFCRGVCPVLPCYKPQEFKASFNDCTICLFSHASTNASFYYKMYYSQFKWAAENVNVCIRLIVLNPTLPHIGYVRSMGRAEKEYIRRL